MIRLLTLFVALTVTSAGAQVATIQLTPRAAKALQADSLGQQRAYWIFLDRDLFATRPIHLTAHAQHRRSKVDPVHFLVDSLDAVMPDSIRERIAATGARIRQMSRWFCAVSVDATPGQVDRIVESVPVRSVDLVQFSARLPEPETPQDIRISPQATSATDLSYGGSLLQNRILASQKMHAAGYTGKGVLIAMFDTGFNILHPAFDSTSLLATWDFINDDPDVTGSDCSSNAQDRHGTGTFGAVGGFYPGALIGSAYGADFILAKTEISCGGTEIKIEEDNWIAAAEWADSIGADIISSSLGYTEFQDSGSYAISDLDGNTARITIAADIAASKNILVCNSAGNERGNAHWPTIIFPADADSVLAVGASGSDSAIASFSSPGPTADGRIKPDITTLGISVYTAAATGGFQYMSGTSLSTPLAAGGAALALESDSQLTAMQLLQQIRESGDRVDTPDNNFGYGMMNAARAANILRVSAPDSLSLDSSLAQVIEIESAGRFAQAAVLSVIGLPLGARLIDDGEGRGRVVFDSAAGLLNQNLIGLVSSIGTFADTTWTLVTYYQLTGYSGAVVAYPNPFSQSLTIEISSGESSIQSVSILNGGGEKVWERVNISSESSDTITIEWDGRNSAGHQVTPGVYLVCVATQRETKVLKILKVR